MLSRFLQNYLKIGSNLLEKLKIFSKREGQEEKEENF